MYRLLFLLAGLWCTCSKAGAQPLHADSMQQAWHRALQVPEKEVPGAVQRICRSLDGHSQQAGLQARKLALQLAASGPEQERPYFNLLALSLEAEFQRFLNKDSLQRSLEQYIAEATLSSQLFLASEACFRLSAFAEARQNYAVSAYFGLKGRDLLLQTGAASHNELYSLYTRLASIAFNTAQFADCVQYGSEALRYESDTIHNADLRNTIGLGYRGLGKMDSAQYWFRQALRMATEVQDKPSMGMVKGNMAQVYFAQGKLDQAYPLLMSDVEESTAANDLPNATNSLQFVARIQAMQGQSGQALATIHTCLQRLPAIANLRYKQNIMEGAALVYHMAGMHDSAWLASRKQIAYRDSMQASISSSRMGAVSVQVNYERSLQNLQQLQLDKKMAVLQRNLVVAMVLLLGAAAWMLINRRRLRMQHKQQMLQQQKEAAEKEAASARAQLQLITENLVAKSAMVDALQQELTSSQLTQDTRQHLEALRQSVILTEDDWVRYRELFENVHPGFVHRLRYQAPDITQAELRLAVLMRLQLESKQMAGMLGISVDSVTKTRRRLKQRLRLPEEASLVEYVLHA